jgi:putative glycosyltransferase (TIGR04348 family)
MNIGLITPAPPRSRAGNRATARRWAHIFRALGHRVAVTVNYEDEAFDLMVALHAWRSADAVAAFRERYPQRPLVVALTGTDLYRFLHSHPEPTLRSVTLADRLVTLHAWAHRELPKIHEQKVRVIYQSAQPPPRGARQSVRRFEVCLAGHLREEKDPLRAAYAVRDLPADSRLFVRHYGRAMDGQWMKLAQNEMARNARYHWYGEVPHWRVREAYVRSRLLVISSRMEGGANVVSEAVAAGLPVVASAIPGNEGLLGDDYPGYYRVGDTKALRACLLRAETEGPFYEAIKQGCERRQNLFTPERERRAWAALIDELS